MTPSSKQRVLSFAAATVLSMACSPSMSTAQTAQMPSDPGRVSTRGADETVPGSDPATDASKRWNVHGQGTVVWQGHPGFRSPYQGDNSLNGGGQGKETVSGTLALGVKLWQGAEIYFNPEVFQGFGLAQTHGLGGFSNGEAQKGGSLYPKGYVARAFARQTFGFGGETEQVEDDFNQIGGVRDISRLTITSGKFAVNDVFDRNSVSQDARDGFLNYAIWEGGAFDYAADQKGYGAGTVIDFNQKSWAFRTGYFLLPIHSNAQTLSWNAGSKGQALAELESRYQLWKRPGILRLLGWESRANAGSYASAAREVDFNPEESIKVSRRVRSQLGYVINLEQEVTDDLSVFSRYSWRDAKSEVMSWADMDASVSAGLVLKGTSWGRAHDKIGLAGAINQLSSDHIRYSQLGGLSVTIGDGRLAYSGEKIIETYYSIGLGGHHTALTFDYQYITNPAYNADRGPVSLFSMRLHGEF